MENQDKKRQLIIDAAVKRFAHFGLAKTTMTEIAADLSISKALLYYYFPDKMRLYAAVLEFMIDEINQKISDGIQNIQDPQKALFYFLEKRQDYIQKYYNILDYIRITGPDLPDDIGLILERARDAEIKIIERSIRIGIEQNKLTYSKPKEAAELLMEAFMGMRYILFSNKQQFQIGEKQFKILLDRQKKLAAIYLKGLQ